MSKKTELSKHFYDVWEEIDEVEKKLNDLYLRYKGIVEKNLSTETKIAYDGLDALNEALTNLKQANFCVDSLSARCMHDRDDIYLKDEDGVAKMNITTVLNLIKYHVEGDKQGFKENALELAKYFEQKGQNDLTAYILTLTNAVPVLKPLD